MPVRTVRWIILGGALVGVGAAAGFAAALLRPRRYADFSGARQPGA